MGIYYKDIEDIFSSYEGLDNHLQKYDNYTYHIQLYIVPQEVYKRYSEIKASGRSNLEQYSTIKQLLNNNKVVLAESGVTPNYDIQSFKMVMQTPVSKENRDMIMTSAEMTLVEVDGASFMNKVAIAAMAAGWNSFVQCPIFIEIWFQGYDVRNGVVVSKIPFEWSNKSIEKTKDSITGVTLPGLDSYIVSCVMEGSSTSQELDKTIYKLKFYPYFYSSVNKDLQIVSDLQPVTLPEEDGVTLGQVLQRLENKLNERMLDIYGKEIYETVYTSNNGKTISTDKPIQIIFDTKISEDEEENQRIIKQFTNSENRERRFVNDWGYGKAAGKEWDENISEVDRIDNEAREAIYNNNKDELSALKSKNLDAFDKFFIGGKVFLSSLWHGAAVNGAKQVSNGLKTGVNLGKVGWEKTKSIFRNWFGKEYDTDGCKDLSDYVKKIMLDYCIEDTAREYGLGAFVEYRPVFVKEFLNKRYYKHIVIIKLKKICGFTDMLRYQFNKIEEPEQPIHYVDEPISKQLRYIADIQLGGLLHKKYYWLFSGKETNLLDLHFADNNLWYMNIGISNLNMIDNSEWTDKPKFEGNEKDSVSTTYQNYDENEILNANYKSEILKNKTGIIYADDLYDMFVSDRTGFERKSGITPEKENSKKAYNRIYNIIEANDPTTEIKPLNSTKEEKEDKESTASKIRLMVKKNEVAYLIGMTNIFQMGGQRLKMNANIVGDPEWLLPSTEIGPIESMFIDNVAYMPHILLCTKNIRTKSGMDDYRLDPLMDLNTLYVITQVTSTFEGGKFLQNLEGFVATPFIQSSNDAISSKNYDELVNESKRLRAETTDIVPEEGN